MNFFEQELRKIVGSAYPDATYIGRACYVRLGEENRAKIQFVTGIVSNQYNALQMTILNRSEANCRYAARQLNGSVRQAGNEESQFPKRCGTTHLG